MVKIQNSKFGMVFLVKICDETYMHLHMKWWFLIFSFHSLTTLCGSATTIAKPLRAINVKIVNFIIFLRNKIDYSAKFDFWLNCRRNLYCLFKAFLRASAKGQIISECPYEIIVYPKIATKKFPRFMPWPLRRGQTKNFIKPIMLNNP